MFNPAGISFVRVTGAIVLYALVCGLLVWWRPSAMFEADGRPRDFGLEQAEKNQSIFAPVVVFPAIALVSYFVVAYAELLRPAVPKGLRIVA